MNTLVQRDVQTVLENKGLVEKIIYKFLKALAPEYNQSFCVVFHDQPAIFAMSGNGTPRLTTSFAIAS